MTAMNITWKLLLNWVFLLFRILIITSVKTNGGLASISTLRSNMTFQPIGRDKSQNLRVLQLDTEVDTSPEFSAQRQPDKKLPPLLNIKYAFRFPMINPLKRSNIQERFTVEDNRTKLDVRPFNQRDPPLARGEPLYGPCGKNFTGLSGLVNSPKYPYNYPPNTHCRYFIETDPSYIVSLNCQDFSIQVGDDNCENDFLEIEIQPSTVTRYCGDAPFSTNSKGNISMTFHSDETFQYRGFMCRYNILYENGSKVESPSTTGHQNQSTVEKSVCLSGDLHPGWSGKCGVATQQETSRILGGTEVRPHEFPWMAAVIVQCRKEPGHYCQICGGTIIHYNWILTAGSCVASFPIEKLGILLGEHNLYVLTPTQKFYKPEEVFVHPEYNAPTPLNNNIALLKLPKSIQFSKFMSPICLPPLSISDFLNMLANESMRIGEMELQMITAETLKQESEANRGIPDETRSPLEDILHQTLLNRTVSIYGWGKTGDVAEVDRELRGVDVQIIPNDICNGFYGVMTDNMICTSGDADKGPCKGDSGSPNLMKLATGQWVQMGSLSFGAATGCEKELPSGNVLLPLYMNWIHLVTGENFMDFY